MSTFKNFVTIVISAAMLSGCAANGQGGPAACNALGPKAMIGIGGGAAAGAAAGAALGGRNRGEGALVGALIGAIAGGIAGKSMDQEDCQRAQMAMNKMGRSKTGANIVWKNPKTGNHGVYKATGKVVKTASGTCRPFHTTEVINGQTIDDSGMTCRDANGDWYRTQS